VVQVHQAGDDLGLPLQCDRADVDVVVADRAVSDDAPIAGRREAVLQPPMDAVFDGVLRREVRELLGPDLLVVCESQYVHLRDATRAPRSTDPDARGWRRVAGADRVRTISG